MLYAVYYINKFCALNSFHLYHFVDQNSLSDFRSNEPKFELDHLATFAAGTRNGVIHAEDGLRKLRQMENTTGIWTMRCILIVERNYVVVVDNSTGVSFRVVVRSVDCVLSCRDGDVCVLL